MTMRDAAAPWPVADCPVCHGQIIRAVDANGSAVTVDAAASPAGLFGLTERGPGLAPIAYKPKARLAFGRPLRALHPVPCYPLTRHVHLRAAKRAEPEKPKAKIPPHPFEADDAIPAEPYSGNYTCKTCLALGRPGDARHPAQPQTAIPSRISEAAAERDAAVLGEKRDDS